MSPWLQLAVAIAAEVVGTSFLKQADGFTRLGPSLMVGLAYAVAFYFLSLALRAIPVGIAYAVWSGVGIVALTLIGLLVFGQRLGPVSLLAVGLILAGIVMLNLATVERGDAGGVEEQERLRPR
ncbi:MAG TPA: multidrug efflux SMR transporter [Methylibium sp.]|nr:multidrug efflux SMR transporter [Methylibium sp.]